MSRTFTFSAVLVNYNHSQYLPKALACALNQTSPFDEIIVIDDCSTDNSVEIITSLIANTPTARLVRNPVNLGVVETLNKGLKEAKGDFIYYLAADDTYDTRIIEWCRKLLVDYPDMAMISGNAATHNIDTGEERQFTLPFPAKMSGYTRSDLVDAARKRCITFYGGANVIRRDALEAVGGQRTELKWHADWLLYIQIALRYPFGVVPEQFVRIRIASDQYSFAFKDWSKQRPVLEAFIRILKNDFPEEYSFFRNNGLLPTYDLEMLPLLLRDKELRGYLTPLLAWRILTYKPLRALGRMVPESLRYKVRRMVRL